MIKAGKRPLTLHVRRKPGNPCRGILTAGTLAIECALGRGSTTIFKREGDGATPVGRHRLLYGFWRNDRLSRPRTALALAPIDRTMGWCEVPGDPNYNRQVEIPYRASHERMMRDDRLYDVVIVLDWNIRPRRQGAGSAIFFHLARPRFAPTEGCVAVSAKAMRRLTPLLSSRTVLVVHR